MTEIADIKKNLPPALLRFVVHWGEMGDRWGVNRSVAQIHALLFVSDRPMTAEEISECLGMARSNVSTSLKELLGWTLVRRVHVLGDRRDFFEAEADMFEMVRRIAAGRKARELDPTLALLRECAHEASDDQRVSPAARKRLTAMLDFMQTVDRAFDEVLQLPAPVLTRLMKMGGTLARLVTPGGRSGAKRK